MSGFYLVFLSLTISMPNDRCHTGTFRTTTKIYIGKTNDVYLRRMKNLHELLEFSSQKPITNIFVMVKVLKSSRCLLQIVSIIKMFLNTF